MVKCPECETVHIHDSKKCENCGAQLLSYGDIGMMFILVYFAMMLLIFLASLAFGTSIIQTAGYALVVGAFVAAGLVTAAIVRIRPIYESELVESYSGISPTWQCILILDRERHVTSP